MTLTPVRAYATVAGPTAVFTTPDGRREHVTTAGDIRAEVLRRATEEARRAGIPLELVTSGDHGDHHLLITTDGTLTPLPAHTPTATGPEPETPEDLEADTVDDEPAPTPTPATPAGGASHLSERLSFIESTAPVTPPTTGWRGVLARLGIPMRPSPYEVTRDGWVRTVSQQWAGCRTIAVVNGKGGVGKTMTTAMLAAVYARHGGGRVLAWDNNDTRGTLGWRTEQGLYDTTLRDLLPAADNLLTAAASVSDITRYVHPQPADRYDVLRSNPELLAADQRLDSGQFDLLMRVAARYYRLVLFDSGNDESADRWLRMIDSTQQLVIPTLAVPESAESAALLLEALRQRDEASAALADGAVVIVTQAEPHGAAAVQRMADRFAQTVRAVGTIPFDPALRSGALRFDQLRPATRDAWLRVAAAAATTLAEREPGHE